MNPLKKKTLYIWMSVIVILTIIGFAGIYFLGLQNEVAKVPKMVDPNSAPIYSQQIYGDFENPLDKPMDLAKIGEFLYVTDTNNKRVQMFDTSGTSIALFGKEGNGPGEFNFPYGITGDANGNVYVADLYNGKISILEPKGNFIKYFKVKDNKDDFKSPGGIRIFNEKLYVTDIQLNKVMVFDLKGKKLLDIKFGANSMDTFKAPNAVTVDKKDNIYIADSGNQRVLVYDKNGKYIRSVNGSKDGLGSSLFVNPRGIGVDSRGILYVVNNLTHFIYGFNDNGEKVFEFGGMGDGNEQFYLPNGLFVDEDDRVYITDTVNQRVALYY
jgi:DNA-binding beta-propeller fold protein YncE